MINGLLQCVSVDPILDIRTLSGCKTINCLNGYSLALSLFDKDFYDSLYSSDLLLCDGVLVKWLCFLNLGRRVKRFTGPDFAEYIFNSADRLGGLKLLYYGSTPKVCSILERCLKGRGSRNLIHAESAPFRDSVDNYILQDACNKIRFYQPDIVFLGMTAPKQEKLAALLKPHVSVSAFVQVGAYFEFAAGTISRSPPIFRYLGMEWIWRLLREPKKIWARILMLRWLV